ncbi:MAG: exodeoxyribonuclease VII large subunit [Planctomycetota bacterium]|nr:exodeoxyribonuclease VII large subunit [Planctomycetota bacterium]
MPRRSFNPDDALGGLFDPPAAPPDTPADPSDTPDPLTPTTLNTRIKDLLESNLRGPIELVGEVSNLRTQGHWYFAIKDETSVVSCVMWRSDAGRVRFEPRNGDELIVSGRVSHWVPGGRTQFYVDRMRKRGVGTLEEQFQALCNELRELGYFDEERKQRLPAFPRRIAVVTSATGAAVEDVRRTVATRLPSVELLIVDVRVQGEQAAEQVASAITRLDRSAGSLGIDAILVTRGGGSREDLWAFNERVVADAAFACRTPLVAAIGHEVDTSVIELIADHRSSTPTQAAMHLVPDRSELLAQVEYQQDRLVTALRRRAEIASERVERAPRELRRAIAARLERARTRVAELDTVLKQQRPSARLATVRTRLAALETRLRATLDQRLATASARLESDRLRLNAVGPRSVFRRGFTCTLDDAGELVRAADAVKKGAPLTTVFEDGRVRSRVEEVESSPPLDESANEG